MQFFCSCFEGAFSNLSESKASRDRLAALQKGSKFTRKALLGLSTQEISVNLSEDTSKIEWKTPATTFSKAEFGEVDLVYQIKTVKLAGETGMQFVSSTDDKCIFEIQSDDSTTRDSWVVAINNLLQEWKGTRIFRINL